MASELKMASAFFLDRRSSPSSSVASGRPMRIDLARAQPRPVAVVGVLAEALAVSTPRPVYLK